MNKYWTLVILLFLFGIPRNVAGQSIPSGDFETWTDRDRFALDHYLTAGLASRSAEAYSGNYSIRLENKLVEGGDDLSGIVTNAILGDRSYSGGEPYDEAPLSMRFYAKYDLAIGDRAEVLSIFMLNGTVLGLAHIELEGKTDTFTRFSVPINWQISAIPDTVVLIISSKDLDSNSVSGDGYVLIDDLHFATFSNRDKELRNGNFENWTSNDRKAPQGWFTVDDVIELSGAPINPLVTRSSEKHGGSYSMKLQNGSVNGQKFPGVAATGDDPNDFEKPAFPVSRNWKYLEAWYRYSPANGDSLMLLVGMFKLGIPVGLTQYRSSTSASEWTYLSVPMQYFTNLITADSAVLMVSAANPELVRGENSTLYVDDMRFSDSPVGIDNERLEQLQIYPNPARDFAFVRGLNQGERVPYTISGIEGRVILKGITTNAQPITLPADLSSGVYQVRLLNGANTIVRNLIIE